jgi:hypothetical protein
MFNLCVGQADGALKQCFKSVMWKKLIEFCNARVSEYSTKHAFRDKPWEYWINILKLRELAALPPVQPVPIVATTGIYLDNNWPPERRIHLSVSVLLGTWLWRSIILFTLSVSESTMKQRTSVFSLQISHPSWFPHPAAEPKLARQFTLTYIDFLCLIQLSSRF